jgi:endonuclease IV
MPGRTNRIGRHLLTSGGLGKSLEAASELGCETAQIFLSNPQGWAIPPTHAATLTVVAIK